MQSPSEIEASDETEKHSPLAQAERSVTTGEILVQVQDGEPFIMPPQYVRHKWQDMENPERGIQFKMCTECGLLDDSPGLVDECPRFRAPGWRSPVTQYFYVIVRKDLSLPDQICQVAHAAAGAGRLFGISEHCHLVLLQVSSEEKLSAVADKLDVAGIAHYDETDPDADQDGKVLGFTAIATRMITETTERRLLRKVQLWKE